MNNLSQVVQNACFEILPEEERLNGGVWFVFQGMNTIHRVWRWVRKMQQYSNRNNLSYLVAGYSLNAFVGDNTIVRITSQVVMISKRVLDCVNQHRAVNRSLARLGEIWDDKNILQRSVKWLKTPIVPWSTPYESNQLRVTFYQCVTTYTTLMKGIIDVAVQIFKLSMCTMDAVDAFYLDTNHGENNQELIMNGAHIINEMVEDKDELIKSLKSSKRTIKKILEGIHCPWDVDVLIQGVSQSITILEKGKQLGDAGGNIVLDYGYRVFCKLFSFVGLKSIAPVPSPFMPWEKHKNGVIITEFNET